MDDEDIDANLRLRTVTAPDAATKFNVDCERVFLEGAKAFPDFEDAVGRLSEAQVTHTDLLLQVLETDQPAKVLHALAGDMTVAKQVAALPPVKRAAAIAAIERGEPIPAQKTPAWRQPANARHEDLLDDDRWHQLYSAGKLPGQGAPMTHHPTYAQFPNGETLKEYHSIVRQIGELDLTVAVPPPNEVNALATVKKILSGLQRPAAADPDRLVMEQDELRQRDLWNQICVDRAAAERKGIPDLPRLPVELASGRGGGGSIGEMQTYNAALHRRINYWNSHTPKERAMDDKFAALSKRVAELEGLMHDVQQELSRT